MYKTRSKYGARKITINGITFDSEKEGARYIALNEQLKAGKIKNLSLQPKFEIAKKFTHGGRTYRTRFYIADFMYEKDGELVVEDSKGYKTQVYSLKRHLFLSIHGERIRFIES